MPCHFIGPSSLVQRWNVMTRHSFNLLAKNPSSRSSSGGITEGIAAAASSNTLLFRVVMIIRKESKNEWGSYRSSRLLKNADDVASTIQSLLDIQQNRHPSIQYKFEVHDFATMPYTDQIALMSSTSVLIGVHGAGISMSQYMPIGSKLCCGTMEIYPKGEFSNGKFFSNMIRKMGIHYGRIDESAANSQSDGVIANVDKVKSCLEEIIRKILHTPTCILESVIDDPFLDSPAL
jgi:hypothetical protein